MIESVLYEICPVTDIYPVVADRRFKQTEGKTGTQSKIKIWT